MGEEGGEGGGRGGVGVRGVVRARSTLAVLSGRARRGLLPNSHYSGGRGLAATAVRRAVTVTGCSAPSRGSATVHLLEGLTCAETATASVDQPSQAR